MPHKHTRLLAGKPLIAWTIEEALKSKYLDGYVVSSDDAEIRKVAQEYGATTIKRPAELAQSDTPTLLALQHAVKFVESLHGKFDYIIEIRATSPLKTVEDIDGMIEKLIQTGADSVIGVTRLYDHHPQRAKHLWMGRLRDFLPEVSSGRRQDMLPEAYVRNGTVYALKRDVVMGKDAKLFGHVESIAYEMPEERSVNIDTEIDFKLAEVLMQERLGG